MRVAVTLVAFLIAPVLVGGQSSPPSGNDPRPRFDTASVKQNTSPDAGINNRFSPGRFAYVNTPLGVFISNAYGFPSDRVVGLPEWAQRDKYDITATHSPEYAAFSPQERAMLQRLLEERFSLNVHRETREMPVFELVKARADDQLGPRLRVATLDCSPGSTTDKAQCGTRINAGVIEGQAVDWRMVVAQLPSAAGRTVIDKTGLQGPYALKLEWNPDPNGAPGDRVTIFTALQEQFGVRLQAARAPLEVLVIDKLERPTPD